MPCAAPGYAKRWAPFTMTRDEFTSFTARTIENVIQAAEAKCGRKLSRDIRFQWLDHHPIDGNVVEELVSKVFLDSDHIYPCVDFGVGAIDRAGKTLSGSEHRRLSAWSFWTELDWTRGAICLRSGCVFAQQ